MPTRYLKPGIRDSELIDQLSPMAETLFYRLIVTVDDFGRADARPAMVKATCYPIKADITAQQCDAMLAELATVGLVDVYTIDGKPYLQLRKWDNAPRAKASKFPAPAYGCAQTYASAEQNESTTEREFAQVHTDARNPRTVLPVTGTETGTDNREPEPKKGAAKFDPTSIELPDWLDREAWAMWCNDRKDRKKPITERAAKLQIEQLGEYLAAGHLPEAVIAHSIAGGFQGLYPPKPVTPAAAPGRAPETFAERSERHARQRVADLIGGNAPSMHDAGDVIDVEPSTPRIAP